MLAEMHKEDIKAALRKQFGTVRAFELAHDLPRGSVSEILRNRRWAKVEKAVEAVINGSAKTLSNKSDSRTRNASHRLNAVAR